MGKVTGFPEIGGIRHYWEFMILLSEEATKNQAARGMNGRATGETKAQPKLVARGRI
jgi:hypothetical protein